MRSSASDFDVFVPRDLGEALHRLKDELGVWTPLAGGTDVMVLFEAGQLAAKRLMSIWGLRELRGISFTDSHAVIGALTTYSEIQRDVTLTREFPSLRQAGSETGGLAIQNRGTIGGNIANASPAADTPPALLVYEAELELVSARGSRWVPYRDFHQAYKKTAMATDELIRAIRLPRVKTSLHHFYRKVGTRKAQAISKVVFAGVAEIDGKTLRAVRIAVGSVAPITLRCLRTEALLSGKHLDAALAANARASIETEVTPIDDIRSTAEFRAHVTGNVLEQFLRELGLSAKG